MDLLSISRAIWRHKLVAIPVILLTLLGALYVLVVKPSVYVASSDLLLVNPPPAPTTAQIAADPSLAKINTNNPFYSLGDLWTADALISLVASGSPPAQIALSTASNDPPIIEITGSGPSPQAAIAAADVTTSIAKANLYEMQKRQGVDDLYMIKTVQLSQPREAKPSNGGKLRSLIAVLALGAILLFIAISAAQALDKRRPDGSISPGTSPGTPTKVQPWEAAGPDRQRTGEAAPSAEAPNGAARPSTDVLLTALRLTRTAEDMLSADITPTQSDEQSPSGSADLTCPALPGIGSRHRNSNLRRYGRYARHRHWRNGL